MDIIPTEHAIHNSIELAICNTGKPVTHMAAFARCAAAVTCCAAALLAQ
jgi:hypothetical protein